MKSGIQIRIKALQCILNCDKYFSSQNLPLKESKKWAVLRSRSRSRWSRNYLRPGAGAEMIFLINIYCSQFGRCKDEENIISNISCYRGVWIFIQKNSVSTYKNAWLLGSSLYIYNKCCRTFTRRVWTDECVVSTTSLWGLIFFVLIFGNFFLLMFCLVRILMTTFSRHY